MFSTINKELTRKRNNLKAREFITESVLGVDEVLPGSEEEFDDIVDVDSVPDEVYKKIDDALEKIVSDPNYDDTEADELLDDDIDDDDIDDATINAIIDEAANAWYDDENIGHPDVSRKHDTHNQPRFTATGSVANS